MLACSHLLLRTACTSVPFLAVSKSTQLRQRMR